MPNDILLGKAKTQRLKLRIRSWEGEGVEFRIFNILQQEMVKSNPKSNIRNLKTYVSNQIWHYAKMQPSFLNLVSKIIIFFCSIFSTFAELSKSVGGESQFWGYCPCSEKYYVMFTSERSLIKSSPSFIFKSVNKQEITDLRNYWVTQVVLKIKYLFCFLVIHKISWNKLLLVRTTFYFK